MLDVGWFSYVFIVIFLCFHGKFAWQVVISIKCFPVFFLTLTFRLSGSSTKGFSFFCFLKDKGGSLIVLFRYSYKRICNKKGPFHLLKDKKVCSHDSYRVFSSDANSEAPSSRSARPGRPSLTRRRGEGVQTLSPRVASIKGCN